MARRRSTRDAEAARDPFATARLACKASRALSFITLLTGLLLPGLASAGWGNENWGEMVWGGAALPVPSMSIEGLIALGVLLGLVSGTLLVRRHRSPRP